MDIPGSFYYRLSRERNAASIGVRFGILIQVTVENSNSKAMDNQSAAPSTVDFQLVRIVMIGTCVQGVSDFLERSCSLVTC